MRCCLQWAWDRWPDQVQECCEIICEDVWLPWFNPSVWKCWLGEVIYLFKSADSETPVTTRGWFFGGYSVYNWPGQLSEWGSGGCSHKARRRRCGNRTSSCREGRSYCGTGNGSSVPDYLWLQRLFRKYQLEWCRQCEETDSGNPSHGFKRWEVPECNEKLWRARGPHREWTCIAEGYLLDYGW